MADGGASPNGGGSKAASLVQRAAGTARSRAASWTSQSATGAPSGTKRQRACGADAASYEAKPSPKSVTAVPPARGPPRGQRRRTLWSWAR